MYFTNWICGQVSRLHIILCAFIVFLFVIIFLFSYVRVEGIFIRLLITFLTFIALLCGSLFRLYGRISSLVFNLNPF